MKHNIFRYIAIAATLLATAVNAGAQYNITGGVGTSKKVTQLDAESYKIRLETFATGTTTVTETATPVDVVLVLDVSGSMVQPKGSQTNVASGTNISYNTVANSDVCYFYRDGDGDYDQIYTEVYNNRYYLYYDYGQGKNYIYNTTNWQGQTTTQTSSTRPDNAPTEPSSTIFTARTSGNNPTTVTAEISRIEALKLAVKGFIDDIELNDHQDKQGKEREDRLGNRISLVTFSTSATRVCGLTLTEGNVQTLKDYVDGFIVRGGTNAGQGMIEANNVLENASADANKVVVMFTDGQPTDNWDAITQSRTTKGTRGAIVYTVGTFTESPGTTSNTYKYLNAVSSNYGSDVSFSTSYSGNLTITGTGAMGGSYYKDASGNVDLKAIFKAISEGIGGSTEPIGSSTQVRDIVTNSFVLPSTVSAAQVKVYTSAASGDAAGGDDTLPPTWGTETDITSTVGITIENVDADGNPTTDATKVKNKALFVTGFEYSKDDTTAGQGDGNWVGPRYKNNKYTFAGKKLIIEFTVKADPEATGGETLTNTENSGVYVQDKDGNYSCINYYEQPHQTLTVNIKIRKTGLRHGESATFELMRIRPKGWDETKTVAENKENIEYNIIGKPIPGTIPYNGSADQPDQSDYYEKMGWVGFKKIILTNKGADGAEVVKDVLVLDPYWVYLVLEDDWGWAYTMTGDAKQVGEDGTFTTSSVEVNPFKFHNTENADAVKHAEAIMINHFKSSLSGSKVEHEKSSKVESFTTPTN